MHIPQDDKLVTEVTKELDSFKQRFFRLIDKAQGKKLEQLEAHRKMVLSDNEYDIHYVDRILELEYELLSDLIKIYKELVNRYVVELALFEWPILSLAKNNQETLSKLYMITFTKLQEVQVRLARIIPPILYSLDDEDFTRPPQTRQEIEGNRTQLTGSNTKINAKTAKWAGSDLNQRTPPCQGGILTKLDHRPLVQLV
jgi:hypothetical protein